VFTARYGLIPYIKQITFSLEKLKANEETSLHFKMTDCGRTNKNNFENTADTSFCPAPLHASYASAVQPQTPRHRLTLQ